MESDLYEVSPEMSYVSKEDEDADASFWRPKVTAVRPAAKETVAKGTTGETIAIVICRGSVLQSGANCSIVGWKRIRHSRSFGLPSVPRSPRLPRDLDGE